MADALRAPSGQVEASTDERRRERAEQALRPRHNAEVAVAHPIRCRPETKINCILVFEFRCEHKLPEQTDGVTV